MWGRAVAVAGGIWHPIANLGEMLVNTRPIGAPPTVHSEGLAPASYAYALPSNPPAPTTR